MLQRILVVVCALFSLLLAVPSPSGSLAGPPAGPLQPPPNGPRRSDPTLTVITGVTVHVNPEKTVDIATVVIRDGRIDSILEGKDADWSKVAPGAIVWPGEGLHIYAAFVEPVLDVDAPQPDPDNKATHWNSKVTPQRNPLEGKGVSEDVAKTLRAQGFGAAAIAPRGGIFRGTAAVVSLARADADISLPRPPVYATRVYHAVSLEGSRGFGGDGGDGDGVRERWPTYPGSQMGVIALIRQTLSDADWQQQRVAAGVTSEPSALDALARAQSGGATVPLMMSTGDELEVMRARAIASEFKRPLIVLGCGTEYQRIDAIARDKSMPLIVPINYPKKPSVGTIGEATNIDLRTLMAWEQAPTNPRRLDAAGLTVALTTATLRDKGSFRENLRTAIRHGLPEARALAMVTTVPARMLGVDRDLGTVEQGKRANLIVADGPLFAKKTKLRDVFVDGVRHEINAAPTKLEGTWAVTLTPAPKTPGEITWTIDKDNGITIKKTLPPGAEGDAKPAGDAKPGEAKPEKEVKPEAEHADPAAAADKKEADKVSDAKKPDDSKPEEKKEPAKKKNPEAKAKGVLIANNRISFTFEHEPLGDPGVFTMSGTIAPDGAAMSGEGLRADGARFTWTATKSATPPAPPAPPPGEAKPKDEPKEGEKAKDDASKDGKDSKESKDNKEDKDDEPVTDVPDKLPGYPFGPYAIEVEPAQESIAFINGTLWTSDARGIIENGAVLISGGKIVYAGPSASMPRLHADMYTTIDCAGKHITPGLIDCHSHTGISGGVNEGGEAVTAEVRIGDVTNPDALNWYRQLAGGITAVNNLHGSANAIGGQNQVNKNRWGVVDAAEMHFDGAIAGIKFALGENVKGSNGGDRSTWRYPQTRMGVESLIRERFIAAREYAAGMANFEVQKKNIQMLKIAPEEQARRIADLAPRRDLELEALAEILAGTRLIHCHSYRQDEVLMLARVSQDFGFRIGTYQHILEGYKVADAIRETSGGGSCFSDWWAYKVEVQDAIPQAGPIMHEQGVVVSFNSDSDEMARRMNVEAAKAVKYSNGTISPAEALKFVTINPAKQLRIEKQTGSLEAGKDADVVVWSGDPLSAFSIAERTYVDGRLRFSLDTDKKMRERDAATRQRLIQKILADKKKTGDKPEGSGDAPAAGGGRGGRPGGGGGRRPPQTLLDRLIVQAEIAQRERSLDLLRRGIDPTSARSGVCGCDELDWR